MADMNTKVPSAGPDVFAGHLGHLTPEQHSSLRRFRELVAEKGLYQPPTADSKASHLDETLLRFLRARRFVPEDALVQFEDTEKWRKANNIEELYNDIDVEQYHEARNLYPQWTGRRDRLGIPLYVFQVRDLTSKRINAYLKSSMVTNTTAGVHRMEAKTPARLLRLFALYDNLIEFIFPLCTTLEDRPSSETPVTQCCNIVDISGVGLKQFWDLRSHMQEASVLSNAHCPETLDKIFIIGAPAFFPTVWGWIKKWFDPVTTSKIFIVAHADVKKTLERMIDPANIPKKYGGQLEYEYGMPPLLDASILEELTWTTPELAAKKTFPRGPMRLHEEKDGTLSVLTLGSVDGKPRREKIATLQPRNLRVRRTATNDAASVLATPAQAAPPSSTSAVESAASATPGVTTASTTPAKAVPPEITPLTKDTQPNGVVLPPGAAAAPVVALDTKNTAQQTTESHHEPSRPDLNQQKTEFFDAPESEAGLKEQNIPPEKGHSLTNGGIS